MCTFVNVIGQFEHKVGSQFIVNRNRFNQDDIHPNQVTTRKVVEILAQHLSTSRKF